MRLLSIAGAVALAIVASAPASAALFTYEFSAAQASAFAGEDFCTRSGCTSTSVNENGLTLSGSFTLDTSMLSTDFFGGSDSFYYDTANDAQPMQFLSGTMSHNGTIDTGSGTGGGRSYYYSQVNGPGIRYLQLYADAANTAPNGEYEYRDDGSLARYTYTQDYIGFWLNADFDIAQIDGKDMVTALPTLFASSSVYMGSYLSETLYDQQGGFVSNRSRSSQAQGQLTSITVRPGGPTTVPEPAMIGLLGLGFATLAAARRRKAA